MGSLSRYVLPGEDGEVVWEPVEPVKLPRLRMVAVSEQDAEVLENLGNGLARLGAVDAAMVCTGIAAAWRVGPEA